MSQLIFQSVSGGSVTLNGPNTAGTYNLSVPAADGTLLYEDATGNITFTNVTVTGLLSITGTSAFKIPVGSTVQRPTTPVAGQIRYNTDGGGLYEGYLPAIPAWYKFSMVPEGQYTIEYLAVAGGGGGGGGRISGSSQSGGGGGAGGYYTSTLTALPSTVFNVIIGAGGPSYTNGNNSSISGIITVIGGGTGGTGNTDGGLPGSAGGAGGSGGGGSRLALGGGATLGQGNAGGNDEGGGGGASVVGTGGPGGAGGNGTANSISGASITYAGGGGGGNQSSPGNGGAGGGGNGGASASSGANGVVNLGGGGGGGGPFNTNGGTGGSGIVYLSMATTSYSGNITGSPTVTTSGLKTILTFTSSGSYTA